MITNGKTANAARVRKHRKKAAEKDAATVRAMGQEHLADALLSSVEMLRRSGLPAPTPEELATEPPADRALGISRIISAATKAVALAKARGELVSYDEHRDRLMLMATALKRVVGQFPAYLPGHITPEQRDICDQAMASACAAALADFERLSSP